MSPFFVLIIIFIPSSMCEGQLDNACNVVPKDPYIEEGSSIDIVCQSCKHVKGLKVFWRLNNESVNESPSSLSNAINSTHTVLSLRNFTHRTATIQCESRNPEQVIGGTIVKTYQKPRKISCVLHHINNQAKESVLHVPESFTCNWEHQNNSTLEINYTVLCATPLCKPACEFCKTSETKCEVKDPFHRDKPLPVFQSFTVTVRAKTAKWEVSSDPYEFHPYDILKITRPKLAVTAFTNYLLVNWSRLSPERNGECQVNYSRAEERTPKTVENLTQDADGNTTIVKVESCVNYSVSIRCRVRKSPWSDWSRETVLTKLNPSHVKLRLWRKIAEQENSQVRKVHAMWTDIPSTCQETVSYTIKHMTGANYTYISCGSSTCDVDVNQDAHRITLTVSHNGQLIAEDSIYVPAVGDSLPQVTDIQTSTSDGKILISWKAPAQPVSGYMIDWTHDGNQYHWNESKYTNATLFDLLDNTPYNITVTPLFDDRTGHGTQVLQICSRVGDPGNVAITSVQPDDKTVSISWDTKSQDPCSAAVINYTVFYRAQGGPLLNVTLGSHQQEVTLKDLIKDSQYSVYVEATALTGNSKSKERFFKTKRFDPRVLVALSVCGSVVIVLVLSLGLCCAVQWKRFLEKPVPNPGLSSVALWPSPSSQKGESSFKPSGELCDKVITEHAPSVSSPSLATDFNGCQTSDQLEEYTDMAIVLAPDIHDKRPGEIIEPNSHDESTAFLSSKSCPVSPVSPVSPYRSQSSVESLLPRSTKPCKRVKQQEKTLKTIYVTLDMFDHGLSRRGK